MNELAPAYQRFREGSGRRLAGGLGVGGAGHAEGGPPQCKSTTVRWSALLRYRTIWLNTRRIIHSKFSFSECNLTLHKFIQSIDFVSEIFLRIALSRMTFNHWFARLHANREEPPQNHVEDRGQEEANDGDAEHA